MTTKYLKTIKIDDLNFIGILEEYEKSIQLFCKIFDVELPLTLERSNINPNK